MIDNHEEIKIFFEQKGYAVNDKMNWFTDKEIFVANELDYPESEHPIYKKRTVIYKKGNDWIVFQPKFGGGNISNKFKSCTEACDFILKFLGPPSYK